VPKIKKMKIQVGHQMGNALREGGMKICQKENQEIRESKKREREDSSKRGEDKMIVGTTGGDDGSGAAKFSTRS